MKDKTENRQYFDNRVITITCSIPTDKKTYPIHDVRICFPQEITRSFVSRPSVVTVGKCIVPREKSKDTKVKGHYSLHLTLRNYLKN